MIHQLSVKHPIDNSLYCRYALIELHPFVDEIEIKVGSNRINLSLADLVRILRSEKII